MTKDDVITLSLIAVVAVITVIWVWDYLKQR